MKFAILTVAVLGLASLAYGFKVKAEAVTCTEENCVQPDCYCSSTECPLECADQPQFVVLAFDDAVTDAIYTNYLEPLLFDRKNPDDNPISATFYVPHEYSDYERVNQLYNLGFDIAVHSVTKDPRSDYWKNANVEELTAEFGGQRAIISTFANIPEEDIVGARTPNFEKAGDNTFEAYQASGLQYDSSWPTRNNQPLYPYTLDRLSGQECLVGACPSNSFPEFFIAPIINLIGTYAECNSILGCSINGNAEEVSEWLWEQFTGIAESNGAPITLNINSGWFLINTDSFEGLGLFLDRVAAEKQNVFFVSHKHVIDWMKSPTSLADYQTSVPARDASCVAKVCVLPKDEETRYMKSCVACPQNYPWLNNPTGA